MMRSSAASPSSSGISTSSVTMSGSSACTFAIASTPLRAVPTTTNSSDAARMSPMDLRMNALSSTTSTDDRVSVVMSGGALLAGRLEILANDRVGRVQLQRALPVLHGHIALVHVHTDVAELE